jgi:hypothetical protein
MHCIQREVQVKLEPASAADDAASSNSCVCADAACTSGVSSCERTQDDSSAHSDGQLKLATDSAAFAKSEAGAQLKAEPATSRVSQSDGISPAPPSDTSSRQSAKRQELHANELCTRMAAALAKILRATNNEAWRQQVSLCLCSSYVSEP